MYTRPTPPTSTTSWRTAESSFGSPSFSPAHRPALHHRQERRRVAARQAARRQPGAGPGRRPRAEPHRDQPHPRVPADDDGDRLRAGQRRGRLAAGAAGAHLRRLERQRWPRPATGDLVFQGTEDGGFYAFEAATGEQLFHYDAGRTIRSSPLTYEVNGTQYVAVIASNTVLAFALP